MKNVFLAGLITFIVALWSGSMLTTPSGAGFTGQTSNAGNVLSAAAAFGSSGITFVAAAQGSATSGTLTISKPAGTAEGHVLIAAISVRPSSVTATTPSGWTLIRTTTSTSGPTENLYTYWKVAGPSEPASYSWTFSASHTGAVGGILAFSGVDTANPIDVHNGQMVTGTANTTAFPVDAPSVTTTVANTMIVTAHAVASSGTPGSAWTPPTGMTEQVDVSSSSGTGGESIGINYVSQASAGATGTKTATVAGHDGPEAVAQTLALKPAGSGGSSDITFRAAAQGSATSGALTINKPAGTVEGDVMVAAISVRPSSVTATAPSGWTLIRTTVATAGVTQNLYTYWKVAGPSEPTSYSWTFSASHTGAVGGILTFSGVDTVNPVDVHNGQMVTGTANTTAFPVDAPSVTTTVANTMIVTAHVVTSSGTPGAAWTPPTGMTERVDVSSSSGTGGAAMSVNDVAQASAGATGVKTATVAGHNEPEAVAQTVALRPQSGISFRSAASSSAPSGTLSLTINNPAGTIAGDVMVASIGFRPSTATITPPSGWTLVRRMDNASGTANSLAVYSRVAGSGEPSSYSWSFSTSTGSAGGIMSFAGVDNANPIDVENGQNTSSGLTHTAPSVDATVTGGMVVASHSFSSSATWTPPSGMAEAVDAASNTVPNATGQSTEASYVLQATSGATGTRTATASNDSDTGNAHILVLRPAP